MSGTGGQQYNTTAMPSGQEGRRPSLLHRHLHPSYLHSTSTTSDSHASSNSQALRGSVSQAAVNVASSGSFRPLELRLHQDLSDWSTTTDSPLSVPSSPAGVATSTNRRPSRSQTTSRRRQRQRRLFGNLPTYSTRERQSGQHHTSSAVPSVGLAAYRSVISHATQRSGRHEPASNSQLRSTALDFAFDTSISSSSPRLEIPEHSLQSFKRSFENAAFPSSDLSMSSYSSLLSPVSPISSISSDSTILESPSTSSSAFSPVSLPSSNASPLSVSSTSPTTATPSDSSPCTSSSPAVAPPAAPFDISTQHMAREARGRQRFMSILGRFDAIPPIPQESASRPSAQEPTSTSSLPVTSAVPLPQAWLNGLQEQSPAGPSSISTTGARHTPPTPEHAGLRIKRRRSRTDGSETVTPPERQCLFRSSSHSFLPVLDIDMDFSMFDEPEMLQQSHVPPLSPDLPIPSDPPYNHTEAEDSAIDAGEDESTASRRRLARDMVIEPDEHLLAEHVEAQRGESIGSDVESDAVSEYDSAHQSPSTATPVSVRRGLHRQFSLGSLPLFRFEEEEDQEQASPTVELEEDTGSSFHNGRDREMSAQSVRFRSRIPTRPNLHRNTTAVSPPEESPGNTPEAIESRRNEPSVYPGLAQWRSTSATSASLQLADTSATVATGEFTSGLQTTSGWPLSGFSSTRTRHRAATDEQLGTQTPQLSLNLEPAAPSAGSTGDINGTTSISYWNVMARSNIPNPAEAGRSRSESESTNATFLSSYTSSSGAAGWHSDAERTTAELLAENLETSRRIAAEVQRLQARLEEAPTPTAVALEVRQSISPHLRASRLPVSDNTRPSAVPPRVSFSSASGSTSREDPPLRENDSRPRPGHGYYLPMRDITSQHREPLPVSQGHTFHSSNSRWGEPFRPVSPGEHRASSMALADVPPYDVAPWSRRPGALGRTNMRGPTRSSNEAWMRSQGIDFYDSYRQTPGSQLLERRSSGSAPQIASVTGRGTPISSTTGPESRMLHRNRVSFAPILQRSASPTPMSPPNLDRAEHSASQSAMPRTRTTNLHGQASIHASPPSQLDAVSLPLRSATHRADRSARAVTNLQQQQAEHRASTPSITPSLSRSGISGRFTPWPERSQRSPGPQLETIRPVSPLFQAPFALGGESRQRRTRSEGGTPAHPLSTSLSGDRTPMSWLHSGQAAMPAVQSPVNTRPPRQGGNHTITDWFRGYTASTRSEAAPPISASVETATADVGEASDGLAAAVRRLDDVRRLLDEVEQNMQRRRRSYEARNNVAATSPSQHEDDRSTSPHRVLRGISIYDSLQPNQPRADRSGPLHPRDLQSVHLPPLAATTETMGTRNGDARWSSNSTGRQDDRYAARESIDPVTVTQGTPSDPTRFPSRLHGDSLADFRVESVPRNSVRHSGVYNPSRSPSQRNRQRGGDADVPPYQPFSWRATSDAYTTPFGHNLSGELSRPRQHVRRSHNLYRSGFALQDSPNTRLFDVVGYRRRPAEGNDDLWHGPRVAEGATRPVEHFNNRRSPQPFLLRPARDRRLPIFGTREGASGFGFDPSDWVADSEIDLSYESLMAISQRLGDVRSRGATEEALANGLTIYQHASAAITNADGETRCGICLEDYETTDECARSNKCGHAFHNLCFTTWLRKAVTCPICRQDAV